MMDVYQATVVLPRPRQEAFEYLRRPANLMKMFPVGTANSLSMKMPEILNVGGLIEFQVKALGKQFTFVHEITQVSPSEKIVLQQTQGPFKQWIQEQLFTDSENGTTLLTNIVRFEPPGGMLGFIVTRKWVLAQLKEWIARGHELIRQDLQSAEKLQ